MSSVYLLRWLPLHGRVFAVLMGSRGNTALFHQNPESSGDGNMVQNNLSQRGWTLNLVERRNLWLLPFCLISHQPSLWALLPEPSQQSHLLKDTSEQTGNSSETLGSRSPCCSQIKSKFQQGSQVFLWARFPQAPQHHPCVLSCLPGGLEIPRA